MRDFWEASGSFKPTASSTASRRAWAPQWEMSCFWSINPPPADQNLIGGFSICFRVLSSGDCLNPLLGRDQNEVCQSSMRSRYSKTEGGLQNEIKIRFGGRM
jgi:hypothetical protein